MTAAALPPEHLDQIRGVLGRHAQITEARLYGSRAKGTHAAGSDVDLAVWGDIDPLAAQAVAAELDELPLPYLFDVQPYASIRLPALREHIDRVGVIIYPVS